MKRYLEKIIIPFVCHKRKNWVYMTTTLAIYDGFCGQTTDVIFTLLASHNICTVQIPANCNDKLQPLNKPMKDHLRANFQSWYAKEVSKQLKTSSVKEVKVDVQIGVVKIPSTKWIMEAWKEMESNPNMAVNGFRKAGILDAIKL